jgi:MYXO-CTERM domain-containing protein
LTGVVPGGGGAGGGGGGEGGGGPTGSGGGGGSNGAGGAAGEPGEVDPGCSCGVAGSDSTWAAGAGALGVAGLLLGRRRKRSGRA